MLLLQQARNRKLLNQIGKQKKKMRIRKIFTDRKIKGEFHLLIANLTLHDHEYLKYGEAEFPHSESPITMRKLCLSTKFQQQEIRWNYDIFRSALA